MFSCEYSKSVRDSLFYRTTLVAAFELSFSIHKRIKEKEVRGEIAFALISLFHVQIQKPASRSTTLRAFVFLANLLNFIITKNLKQEVHDDLSICMNERSLWGLSIIEDKDLLMSHDQR